MSLRTFPKSLRPMRPSRYQPVMTGWVVFFPSKPRMWFEPGRAAEAMETLQGLIRDHLAISGRPPRYAGLAYMQGTEDAQAAA